VWIERGFKTGDAKITYLEGRFEAGAGVPAAALAALVDQRPRRPGRSGPRMLVTAAEPSESDFESDRGPRRLPAWRLTAQDALGPIWVLDPDVVDWQPASGAGGPPPELPPLGQDPYARVDIGDDERSVVVHWLGAVREFERYPRAEVVESIQAFAIVPIGEDIGPPGNRTLAGVMHEVPAVLREPVGARVYVDLHGHAGGVVRSADAR
jgi:hypothetical protein